MTEYKFEYVHDDIFYSAGCGKPAFYLQQMPLPLDVIKSDGAQLLDGRTPEPSSPIICGSCGEPILNLFTKCVRRRA